MRGNLWICVEILNDKYIRPMNHINCDSISYNIHESMANEQKIKVDDSHIVGKLYDVNKINK